MAASTANMNTIIAFIQNRAPMLCDIYTKEFTTNNRQDGVLALTIRDGQMKVAFITDVSLAELNPDIYKELIDRRAANNENIIYFYGYVDSEDGQADTKLFELDIRDFIYDTRI